MSTRPTQSDALVDLASEAAIREAVRERYAARALQVLEPVETVSRSSCCGGDCCSTASCCDDPVTGKLYTDGQTAELPEAALKASLGCGNPTALIDLKPGQTVLDLGSGGGIDVILSARRVGATGKVYGVDMTDEMLALARRNAAEAGVTNVEFRKGQIEEVPLPDGSVDVVISNCVINLASDKGKVLREAYRVLKPGGRFAVSDVVIEGPVPSDLRRRVELWVGCIAGALEREEYAATLGSAGFADVDIVPTRYYQFADFNDPELTSWLDDQPEGERERLGSAFFSAFVWATKPDLE